MERRRLKLHGAVPETPALAPEHRAATVGRCLAIADTENGAAAVEWSLCVLEAAAALGVRLPVVFSAFGAVPELERGALARLQRTGIALICRSLTGDRAATDLLADLRQSLSEAPLWLLVGEPALVSFQAPLRVLITGARPLQAWPAALKAVREQVSLELVGPRGSLAQSLVRLLVPTPPA